MVIHFLSIQSWLETPFDLGFNYFLNNLFLSIEFSPLLLHLDFNQEFETFPKNSNKISLFFSPVTIKLQ